MGTFDSADLLLGAQGRPAPPCVMVIFGAAGDLTKRKLIPALYNLARSRLLPDQFAIVGVSREEYSIDEFRTRMAPEAGNTPSPSWTAKPGIGSRNGCITCPAIFR